MFHDLPLLLQWKVLRQYVPAVDKVCTLRRMPEFGRVLDCEESWLGGRVLGADDLASLVEPGVYVPRLPWTSRPEDEARDLGYFVTRSAENAVTFELIDKYESLAFGKTDDAVNGTYRFSMDRSKFPKVVGDLLRDFFREYERMDDAGTRLYAWNNIGHFFVNHSLACVRWVDGGRYELKGGRSFPLSMFEVPYKFKLVSKSEGTASDEDRVILTMRIASLGFDKRMKVRPITEPKDAAFPCRNKTTFRFWKHGDVAVKAWVFTKGGSFLKNVVRRFETETGA